jgi:hypothetical protein
MAATSRATPSPSNTKTSKASGKAAGAINAGAGGAHARGDSVIVPLDRGAVGSSSENVATSISTNGPSRACSSAK